MLASESQPDYSGLQTVEQSEAPEVVQSSRLEGPVQRRSSLHSPEAISEGDHTPNGYRKSGYIQDGTTGAPAQDYYSHAKRPEHDAQPYNGIPPLYEGAVDTQVAEKPRQKRVCGLKRNLFFIVLAVIILLVAIAAVLGGVLGSVLNKPTSREPSSPTSPSGSPGPNTSSPNVSVQAYQNSGVSLIVPVGSLDGTAFYSYYQDAGGAIVENAYANNALQTMSNDTAVAASNAAPGSPIAATSWLSQGATYRQLFYFDSSGNVMTTNTTGSQAWPTAYNVLTGDSADPNTIALAVCSDTQPEGSGLDGIRVYYGSSKGYIQEVGMDFSEGTAQPIWHMWASFNGSDIDGGVSCAVSDNKNHMYLRNSSGTLQQWQWDYVDVVAWTMDAIGPANITSGSDIAVTNDGSSTDHIFYQTADGRLNRALYYGQGITDDITLEVAASGTKLTATYANNSAMVMYQKPSNTMLHYDLVTRSGQEVGNGIVT